ncbi:hypothetical protein [Nocardia yamanashiensis]|uniref:hypothetical protein n=1 Tax=Nocardia yamanashiensis TaxID=209247 RepID=UPI000A6F3547
MRAYEDEDGYMRVRRGYYSGRTSVLTLILFAWLLIGAVAGGQRHYYQNIPDTCASIGTIAVTIAAGPLNYLGVNPAVASCDVEDLRPSP